MAIYKYKVNLKPLKVFELIKQEQYAELVYEEYLTVDEDKSTATLIYEKYYFRSSNRAALIVLIDNFKVVTEVKAISTGSSQGIVFNLDWGAADNFANSVGDTLKDYIID